VSFAVQRPESDLDASARHQAGTADDGSGPRPLGTAGAGRARGRADGSLLASARKGKQVIRAQKFDILNCVVDGDNVALEVFWTGLLATSVEGLPPNSELRAHVSIFLEFRDGKICRQHNYDCFDPWWV